MIMWVADVVNPGFGGDVMRGLKKNLEIETDARLSAALGKIVAEMCRLRGKTSDRALGRYLTLEMQAIEIGNEIKDRAFVSRSLAC